VLDSFIGHRTAIQVFYRRQRVFILDSAPASSLTLRDYSKVVASHKL
jgi:hypothetical protein